MNWHRKQLNWRSLAVFDQRPKSKWLNVCHVLWNKGNMSSFLLIIDTITWHWNYHMCTQFQMIGWSIRHFSIMYCIPYVRSFTVCVRCKLPSWLRKRRRTPDYISSSTPHFKHLHRLTKATCRKCFPIKNLPPGVKIIVAHKKQVFRISKKY